MDIKGRLAWLTAAIMAAVIFVPGAAVAADAPTAKDCVEVVVTLPPGNTITVCVPKSALPNVPGPKVTVPGPKIKVPGPTKTVRVPQPRRTIYLKGETITRYIERPGPTRTIVRNQQIEVPGPTVSATSTTTVTATPEVQERTRTEFVTVTKLKAVGLSLALVLLGIILALLGMAGAYKMGYRFGDNGNRAFIREMLQRQRDH